MQDFEKMGSFYLGRQHNLKTGETNSDYLLYDSKDLTTHAVVVGMTGSGKTGLCITLLEEAGLDRIPAIVIDPKGDIANLLLTFPGLSAQEFRPWVDESQANRNGMTGDQFAAAEANKWSKGLAKWDQDGTRIQNFRNSVEMRIYTPGSNAGRPLTILKSFAAPPPEVIQDGDAFRSRISSAASGLLALLGIDADPIRSREHILVSKILETAWIAGKNLDIARLIGEIQSPPFERVGVMDIDSFFPAGDRMELAMTLNNLLASPTFASWMEGEPLDIKRMLHTPEGKPCISIMSIAHLTESERMFFVTILLNEILSWMRSQAGTSSLRALLYMDEVFGYFPPTATPPSKLPMLTLLKQARAYGLGVVLATQNPVDLDYKGLSNTGTWFLGRLQTERDKMRVLEGLEGASAQTGTTFKRSEMEATLAGLGSRKFLMNNVHEDEPVVFETRWAMSYLRGPLTRNQIQSLVRTNGAAIPGTQTPSDAASATTSRDAAYASTATRPPAEPAASTDLAPQIDGRMSIPNEVQQRFVVLADRLGSKDRLVYRPAILGKGRMHFSRSTYKVDSWIEKTFLATAFHEELPDEIWDEAQVMEEPLELNKSGVDGALYGDVSPKMQKTKQYAIWEKELKDYLYRKQDLILYKCAELKKYSTPEETEGDFRVRLEQLVSEKRDREVEKLRKKFASKFKTMEGKVQRAQERIEREKDQYKQKRLDSILSAGSSILGAVLGRKKVSSTNVTRASSSMRSFGRAAREKSDIGRAADNLEQLQIDRQELEADFEEAVAEIQDKLVVEELELEEMRLRPKKTDLSVEEFCVLWLPFRVDQTGMAEPAY